VSETEVKPKRRATGVPFKKGKDPRRFKGGRPKVTRVAKMMRELAEMCIVDPEVQGRILDMARKGTLPSALYIEFIRRIGGSVPQRVEVGPPSGREAEQRRLAAQYAANLTKPEQRALAELTRKAMGRPAPERAPRPEPEVVEPEPVEADPEVVEAELVGDEVEAWSPPAPRLALPAARPVHDVDDVLHRAICRACRAAWRDIK